VLELLEALVAVVALTDAVAPPPVAADAWLTLLEAAPPVPLALTALLAAPEPPQLARPASTIDVAVAAKRKPIVFMTPSLGGVRDPVKTRERRVSSAEEGAQGALHAVRLEQPREERLRESRAAHALFRALALASAGRPSW
jgi:hypothetical protein